MQHRLKGLGRRGVGMAGRVTTKARQVAADAGLASYRPGAWRTEEWEPAYVRGQLDYFADLDELPRYSILRGWMDALTDRPSVLDIGCGPGLLRRRLHSDEFSRYTGIDLSADAIETARDLEDARTSFLVGDAMTAPLPIATTVVLNEVLSVVPDPVGLLRRARSLVEPGGYVLSSNWRHGGDRALWRLMDRELERVDCVVARNPSSRLATRGWYFACHRPPT